MRDGVLALLSSLNSKDGGCSFGEKWKTTSSRSVNSVQAVTQGGVAVGALRAATASTDTSEGVKKNGPLSPDGGAVDRISVSEMSTLTLTENGLAELWRQLIPSPLHQKSPLSQQNSLIPIVNLQFSGQTLLVIRFPSDYNHECTRHASDGGKYQPHPGRFAAIGRGKTIAVLPGNSDRGDQDCLDQLHRPPVVSRPTLQWNDGRR